MRRKAAHQVTRTWIFLVLLTLVSMAARHAGTVGLIGNGVVLMAATIKGRWMLMDFLKLRDAPPSWRFLLVSWLALIAASSWLAAAVPLLRG